MVEASVCGVEFCAMHNHIDFLRICYKLCMMSILMDKPTYVYGNNMSIVINARKPKLTLKNKLNSICYHTVHYSVAIGKALVFHIPTKKNLVDPFTKVLYQQVRQFLMDWILWDVYLCN